MSERSDFFGPSTEMEVVGARVRLLACRKCGAAIVLDERDGFLADDAHISWHKAQEQSE